MRLLASRFDSNLVICSESKLLLTCEVIFGSLTEEESDLVELTAG